MAKRVEAEEKDPVDPAEVAQEASTRSAQSIADFSFAVNTNKVNRAKAHVQQQQVLAGKPALKGKELQDAVKARYIDLGGLLVEDKPTRGPKRGRVQNLADNDED